MKLDNADWLFNVNIFYALTFSLGLRYNWIYSYGSLINNFGLGHLVTGWEDYDTMMEVIGNGQYPKIPNNIQILPMMGFLLSPGRMVNNYI